MVASKIYTASILAAMIPLALHAADTAAAMDPAAPGSNQQNGARSAAPGPFFCAAGAGLASARGVDGASAKRAVIGPRDEARLLAIFTSFADGGPLQSELPVWADDIFNPDRPGSLSHYYRTMSLEKFRLLGEVAPRRYAAVRPLRAYLADDTTRVGEFGQFSLEVLRQADADIDFGRFDNDGPDKRPNSGDDDGVVDGIFIILAQVPKDFIIGGATGVAHLGFEEDFATDDLGASGEPIRIDPSRGSLQQGRTFAEAVGAMSHEYGHLLGLPDLYNVDFVRSEDLLPARDSAGIGAWGLMGWGTLGWNGDDGPNSMCAWSRWKLGWLEAIEPTASEETLELGAIGQSGQVGKLNLSGREFFLLEYRTRNSSHYDRHLPAEGLLVWHVERTVASGDQSSQTIVDLECADGRWLDAGYPLGQIASLEGGDNLDFWAHDQAYAAAHGGNLGDATDVFDGLRFPVFSSTTNPDALSNDGTAGVRLENMHFDAASMRVDVAVSKASVELTKIEVTHAALVAGAAMPIPFAVANRGGLGATGLSAHLYAEDPLVEIVHPEIPLRDLAVDEETLGADLSPVGFPLIRVERDFSGDELRFAIVVEIRQHGELVDRAEIELRALKSVRLAGVVSGAAGEPLEAMRIEVTPLDQSRYAVERQEVFFHVEAFTDQSGHYEIFLPPGTYAVRADPRDEQSFAYQYHRDVKVAADQQLDFVLSPLYILQGRVRDPDGQPLSGVRIIASGSYDGDWYYEVTWATPEGTYELRLPPATFTIEAGLFNDIYPRFLRRNFIFSGDQRLDIDFQSGIQLRLQWVDAAGGPVAGLDVSLKDENGNWLRSATTGAQGEAIFTIAPGVYSFAAAAPQPPFLPAEHGPVQVLEDTTMAYVLRPGATIEGYVLDEDGNRFAAGESYQLIWVPVDRAGNRRVSFGLTLAQPYALALEPGRYEVRFSGADAPDQRLGIVDVAGDAQIDFSIRRGVALEGRIALADHPFEGADLSFIYLIPLEEGAEEVFVDMSESGRRAFNAVPGLYQVFIGAVTRGGNQSIQFMDFFQLTDNSLPELVPAPVERVAGQLVDADGAGLADARVLAVGSSMYSMDLTDSQGRFTLLLGEGSYTMQVDRTVATPEETTTKGYVLAQLHVPVGGDVELQMPGDSRLSGRLVDARGQGLDGRVLVTRAPAKPHVLDWGLALAETGVNSAGAYALEAARGRYDLVGYRRQGPGWLGRVLEGVELEGETPMDLVVEEPERLFSVAGQIFWGARSGGQMRALLFYDGQSGVAGQLEYQSGDRYEIHLPPGRYEVSALVVPHRLAARGQYVDLGAVECRRDMEWDIHLSGSRTAVMGADLPQVFENELRQNYPNPFNARTWVSYQLAGAGEVQLDIYNISGQRVRRLQQGPRAPGAHQVLWDGTDESGKNLASGVYFMRLQSAAFTQTRRLLLLK